MLSRPTEADGQPAGNRTVTWLRIVKLVLSIVLLALGILEALRGLGAI